jgi:ligand-binding sensor domain-containing protein
MWNKRLFVVLLSALFLSVLGLGAEEGKSYYALNRQNGLSSNCVLQMLQLRDGRMVVVTDKAVDVYDGQRFLSVAIDTTLYTAVPAYNGATHLFADGRIGCG